MIFTNVNYICSERIPMSTNQREELRQMTLVARLYYEDQQTQESIAHQLGVSRPIVSRLLQRAREEGIVQISIVDPFDTDEVIANQLIECCNLQTAIVVPGNPDRPDLTLKRIGLAASRYLEQTLLANDIIGVGWGRTLHNVIQALTPTPNRNLTVVPLLGGLGQISPNFQVHEITRTIAEVFGGSWKQLYIPAIISDEATRATLYRSLDIQELVKIWKTMTVALVGIGNVDFDAEMQMLFANYLDENTRSRLRAGGAVGDICMRFFDIDGHPLSDGLRGVTGIELEQLRRIPRVVAAACGVAKAEAILGALHGKYINVLITDDIAAKRILTLTRRS
jgi:deoxyribonucleoside regulator